ncbi:MAG: ATP-binding protein [Snowella sp.]|nr:ATP-binding protein [Snowella sp.]
MKIQKFSFSHHQEGWHINEISFDEFNLLVGPSGVGKTRILRVLELIFDVASDGGHEHELDNMEWSISFSHLNNNYEWRLRSNSAKKTPFSTRPCQIILEELIQYNDDNSEVKIISRNSSKIQINGKDIPKLKATESAITVFSEDDSILPISQGFKSLLFNEVSQENTVDIPFDNFEMITEKKVEESEYQQIKNQLTPIAKGFLLQELHNNEAFHNIKNQYINIFPGVQDIRIGNQRTGIDQYTLFFEIKEEDLEEWIPQFRISSGMFRTLMYIIEVMTASEGSIILIDEFENSLGMNCMAELADFILDHAEGIQFIITSHHPYIINNIPWQDWQIVSRKGNHIQTTKATDISALDTASSLDKFTQLINVLEFEDIAA